MTLLLRAGSGRSILPARDIGARGFGDRCRTVHSCGHERYGLDVKPKTGTHMKTTVELPDELLEQARSVVRTEGTTLRGLVEEGLQRSLEARRRNVQRRLDFPTYGGRGLTAEFQGAP